MLLFQYHHIDQDLFHNSVNNDHDNMESLTSPGDHQRHQHIRKKIRLDQKQFLVVRNRRAHEFQKVVE